ncbi:hypothetical protein D3OALGA1CA_3753 [Olavius algarvensis associated proteobacterium Delta 3]|nr:hypothetical protein D3OALGA1CA_3753 [Olavius algarvensis associated proteobacterium Delta 3]CAB5149424.1 hypothetical protein D3OALGB2SA_4713 [Olavius algarvensis associated proteobacterium Delta 3]
MNENNNKRPSVDLSQCNLCLACVEVYPQVFRLNEAGFVEIIEQSEYPEDEVEDAIKYCPEDCILWE